MPPDARQHHETIVRRSVRHDVVMRAAISVHPDYAHAVKLTPASGAKDGWLEVDVVDFAAGGLGFMSPIFLPRRTLLLVHVFGPWNRPPAVLECPARIQRITMTDRRPAFLIGVAFDLVTPEIAAQIDGVLEMCGGWGEEPTLTPPRTGTSNHA